MHYVADRETLATSVSIANQHLSTSPLLLPSHEECEHGEVTDSWQTACACQTRLNEFELCRCSYLALEAVISFNLHFHSKSREQ